MGSNSLLWVCQLQSSVDTEELPVAEKVSIQLKRDCLFCGRYPGFCLPVYYRLVPLSTHSKLLFRPGVYWDRTISTLHSFSLFRYFRGFAGVFSFRIMNDHLQALFNSLLFSGAYGHWQCLHLSCLPILLNRFVYKGVGKFWNHVWCMLSYNRCMGLSTFHIYCDWVQWHSQSCAPFGRQVARKQNWVHLPTPWMSQWTTAAYNFGGVKRILANSLEL